MRFRADARVILALGGLAACAGAPTSSVSQETPAMSKSGSRIPALQVPPVVKDGVRYEQVRNGIVAGLGQMGGYLAAVRVADGTQLWTLKVYDNARDPEREGDVQDVFFASMVLQDDGTLLIENERGAKFVVDPEARTSTPVE
jgi:hypothetical protein